MTLSAGRAPSPETRRLFPVVCFRSVFSTLPPETGSTDRPVRRDLRRSPTEGGPGRGGGRAELRGERTPRIGLLDVRGRVAGQRGRHLSVGVTGLCIVSTSRKSPFYSTTYGSALFINWGREMVLALQDS